MGQHFMPVNLDKHEFLDPHKLGDGLKFREQGSAEGGCGDAIRLLLAVGLDRNEWIGRWAGDRIAVIGDYVRDDDMAAEHAAGSIYDRCLEDHTDAEALEVSRLGPLYTDITDQLIPTLEQLYNVVYLGDGWRQRWSPFHDIAGNVACKAVDGRRILRVDGAEFFLDDVIVLVRQLYQKTRLVKLTLDALLGAGLLIVPDTSTR